MVGPLLAVWPLYRGMSIRDILLWTLVPGVMTVGLALCIREAQREMPLHKPAFIWTLQGFPPAFKRYLRALFTLGNSSNMFLLLRAREMGVPESQVPLLWELVSATAMLFSTPLSALTDPLGRTRLIVGGWAVYGVFYLLIGLNGHSLWMLFAFCGLFMAATEGAGKPLVSDLAPKELLGTAYGWFNLTAGVMLLPASQLFGWLWQTVRPEAAFGFSASCAILAALLLKFWVPAQSGHTP